MTDPLEPTDAELWQLHMQMPGQHKDPIDFARAVLTSWGQPAQAAEPVAWAFKYDDGTWHDPSTTEHSSGMRPLFEAPHPVACEPLIRQLVAALEGYRRNHNDAQPCDAERAGRAWLEAPSRMIS